MGRCHNCEQERIESTTAASAFWLLDLQSGLPSTISDGDPFQRKICAPSISCGMPLNERTSPGRFFPGPVQDQEKVRVTVVSAFHPR